MIQQSHPVCNTIMLFGVITCLVSVILLGIDGQFVDSSTYPKVSQGLHPIHNLSVKVTRPLESIAQNGILMNPFTFIRLSIKFHIGLKAIQTKLPTMEKVSAATKLFRNNLKVFFLSFNGRWEVGMGEK